ncbi:MAG: N-acetylneuraminate synthase family protein, partial [Desulfobacteraceae bacterium]
MDSVSKKITIGKAEISYDSATYIIAEIGINHNGEVDMARTLIDSAADAGANAVKFQKRHLQSLYHDDVLDHTQRFEQYFQYMIPILKRVELEEKDHETLKCYAESKGLEYICTPFDVKSAGFLAELGVNAFKISSADLTNLELIEYCSSFGKPLLVSTGMSWWDEIEKTVDLLRRCGSEFALLHCRSVYPVWPRDVNLRMINRLREFGCPVGYSGHDIGITIPLVAASMGACIIEKHITLNKRLSGPDHKISLEPFELKRLVRDIRVADQAMGKTKRFLLRGEIINRELFGKSLVAALDISPGDIFTRDKIMVKGPGKGLSPNRMDDLIGKSCHRLIRAGDYFTDEDLSEAEDSNFSTKFRTKWGLIARYDDFETMVSFSPKVIEFHLTEEDLNVNFTPVQQYQQELVVHAPEYIGEKLMDLCSADETIRRASIDLVNKTIIVGRKLSAHFSGTPIVIAHPGAMSMNAVLNKQKLKTALLASLKDIDCLGVELIFENLPPYPWYFGGAWKGNYFMSAEEISIFCQETGMKICFDLSHAALYCNAKEKDLCQYIETILPHTRHLHLADGYGLDGEGVQLGEGDIELDQVMTLFKDYQGSWVPEIWRG